MTPLSDRLAALTGPDREVDADVTDLIWKRYASYEGRTVHWKDHEGQLQGRPPDWTSDINVIVAEIERRGWRMRVGGPFPAHGSSDTYWYAIVWNGDIRDGWQRDAPTPCLALLRALVDAIEAP